MKTYLTVKIQGHEGEVLPEGKLLDAVVITLIDPDPKNAMKRAKKLIKKKHYRYFEITEYMQNHD